MFSRAPFGFKIFFGIVVCVMIGGVIFNVLAYQDCRKQGVPMYVCAQVFNSHSTALVVNSN